MILVLAHPTDLAARSFVSFAEEAGVRCFFPQDIEEVALSVESDRTGKVTVMLCNGEATSPVHGILNRGLPIISGDDAEERFKLSETLAAWWTALACFKGPVINRPSREGYLPSLDVLSFSKYGLDIAPTYISTNMLFQLNEPQVNLYLLRNGELIQKGRREISNTAIENEVFSLTGFDPNQTFYTALVGHQLFNLSDVSGEFSAYMKDKLRAVQEALISKSALFSLLVLQHHDQRLRIIQANSFPALYHYQHLSSRVNQSLLNYLMS